jgi:hypothetical protein
VDLESQDSVALSEGAVEGVPDEDADASPADIIQTALKRFQLAEEAITSIRKESEDDLEFIAGKQWPLETMQERELDNRPCLTVNRLPQQVQQVTNDQRQNRPSVKVSPVDSAATEDLADIIEGLIRHVEYNSNAETAYDTAGESAARCGLGYWRLKTGFVDPESFDQEVYIKRIRDPFSVRLDPYSQEPDGSDANWGFIIEDLSPEEYRARYPGSKLGRSSDWNGLGNSSPTWLSTESARVAEYFYKEFRPAKIHRLATGETVHDRDLPQKQLAAAAANIDASVVKTRITKIPVVKWCTITAVEVLEESVWPGSFIPIIPVYGNELYVKGKRILESVIRHAKGPQQLLNFMRSAAAETIGLAPRAPWVVAEGQIEDYDDIWKEANRKNHAYLPYKPQSIAGTPVPPPQRQTFEPATQAIMAASATAADDIKATTGVYDAALGAQGNETAGVAIDARSKQTQISNYHFFDNMKRSLRHTGRCLVEILPFIYDSARAARIIKEDGTQSVVRLNQKHTDPETGKEVLYSLQAGRYDVTIDTGPSFATRRQEAAEGMLDFTKAMPNVAQFTADLIARNMDWPGAQEMADRFKLMLPPALQNDGKQPQIPPQIQAQFQQMSKLIQQLKGERDAADYIVKTKQVEEQAKTLREAREIQSKETIEKLRIQSQLEMTLATLGSKSAIEQLKHTVGMIQHSLDHSLKANPPSTSDDSETSASDSAGGSPAMADDEAPQPTGGQSPGPSTGG